MFRQSGSVRAISADLGAIDRRLHALERNLRRIGGQTTAGATEVAGHVGETVVAALSALADRFRESRDEAGKLGREAARMSDDALRRLSNEIERRPLVTLAVAVGVGILVGFVSCRASRR